MQTNNIERNTSSEEETMMLNKPKKLLRLNGGLLPTRHAYKNKTFVTLHKSCKRRERIGQKFASPRILEKRVGLKTQQLKHIPSQF
jgi:hypothetical protein